MSAMLVDLEEGENVYPYTNLGLSASTKVTFSGFELPDDTPAFTATRSEAFTFTSSGVAFGDEVTTMIFERGTEGAVVDGVYTVPEDGYYYFITKLRPVDDTTNDVEIEWKLNGNDASSINYEMWYVVLHSCFENGIGGARLMETEIWLLLMMIMMMMMLISSSRRSSSSCCCCCCCCCSCCCK